MSTGKIKYLVLSLASVCLLTACSKNLIKEGTEQLEQGDYSREEISQGLLAAAKQYGYDGMVGALLS